MGTKTERGGKVDLQVMNDEEDLPITTENGNREREKFVLVSHFNWVAFLWVSVFSY